MYIIKLFIILIIGLNVCLSCDVDQIRFGCVIREQACSCGYGCKFEYRYESMQECQNALKGKKKDICKTNSPCLHGGSCIQISQQPGYRCRCEGTGYFGLRCNRACPIAGAGRQGDVFPYECIVI